MTKTVKKITRRDAMKVAAAAVGAAALANLPSKWSKPELAAGILPAHAQTSIMVTLECDPGETAGNFTSLPEVRSGPLGATLSPSLPGIEVSYQLIGSGVTINTPDGMAFSDINGRVEITGEVIVNALPSFVEVTFTAGISSCSQRIDFDDIIIKRRNGSSWNGN